MATAGLLGGSDDPVDNTNAAVAAASCTSCQTTAVAFQILIVTNDTHDFEPVNLAIAVNVECTDCDTLASAYQWVFQTDGVQPHITADGNRRLAEVRREAQELRQADLSVWDLQARIQELADEVYAIYRDDLVLPGA